MNMDIKATIYDILGYLTVGVVAGTLWLLAYEHSMGRDWTYARMALKETTATEIFVLLLLAYLLGHAIGSVSSFLIEKPVEKLGFLRVYHAPDSIVSQCQYTALTTKFMDVFGFAFARAEFPLCICYAESAAPNVYETAFVFLSFYGMARNITLVFISYGVWELANAIARSSWSLAPWAAAGFAIAAIFFYHYLRFLRYFRQRIVGAFLVGSEERARGQSSSEGMTDDENAEG
jgi:hypothetical protein